jgi:para-nitrobenzyl esterase
VIPFARHFSTLVSLVLLVWLLGGCGDAPPDADPATLREVRQGKLVGRSLADGEVHAWLGIPYAQPPEGPLRWRATRPPETWEGTREALESGQMCSQLGGDPVSGGEDCLTLDVYTPAFEPAAVPTGPARRPVMYWIHGGGNSMGWGHQIPPTRLAAEHDVIVVTINYRLGIFGWLSHPALRASAAGPEEASGNFGTLDMIRGLEWVRDNIERFGGDPQRITIFGESAGGVDVFSLLISPPAEGLFQAAIVQSGIPATVTRSQAEAYTDDADPGLPGSSGELLIALVRQAGRAEDRESAKAVVAAMGMQETENFLRGLTTEELLSPFVEAVGESGMPIYISPAIYRDGHVIRDGEPVDLFGTPGGYSAVPVIAGTNRDESKLFYAFDSPHVSRTFGFPTGFESERLYDMEGEYGGLVWRAQGADEPISAMRRVQGPSAWAYRFDWDEEGRLLGLDLSKLLGAAHALELLFVFGVTDLGFANHFFFDDRESAEELSRVMRSYWTNFAHTTEPGRGQAGDLPAWTPWSAREGGAKYMIFDSARDGGLRMGTDRVDQAMVVRRVLEDPRFQDDSERCSVFRNLVRWSNALTPKGYEAIGNGACRPHPLGARLSFGSLSHQNDSWKK